MPHLHLLRCIGRSWQSEYRHCSVLPSRRYHPTARHLVCAAVPASNGSPASQHQPVLQAEVLDVFAGCRLHTFLDGTLGAGGHSLAIIRAHPELQQLVGMDVDPYALSIAEQRLIAENRGLRLCLVQANFSTLQQTLKQQASQSLQLEAGEGLSGILLDIGVSSMQLDTPERGFSFSSDGPLDMRMGPSAKMSAADVVNTFAEAELGTILREYGEERHWRRLARNICEARGAETLHTTHQLVAALRLPAYRPRAAKQKGQKQIHPATRVFQVS